MIDTLKLFLACIAASAVLGGCGGASGTINGGQVRVVNATSDFATIDLYESSTKLTTGTATYAVGNYADINHGAYIFNLAAGGSSATAATLPGIVEKKSAYTIVGYTTGGALTAAYLSDNEGDPSSGTAKLRIFNTDNADAGSVDVYLLTSACASLASTPSSPIASGVTGLQTGYIQVIASSGGTAFHLCVTAAGDKTDLRLDIPVLTLKEKQIATVILTRSKGGVLLNGLVLLQQGALTQALNTSARVRLAVGVSSPSTVSAAVNGVQLGVNLPAPAISVYKLVNAGALTVNLSIDGAAVPASGLTAAAGSDGTLLVTGTAAASTPTLIVDDNTVSTSTARPVKLRLVNGMNGSGSVTLTDDYNPIGNSATVNDSTVYTQVLPSAALARIEATSGTKTLCLSPTTTLNSGAVYTVFVLGDVPTVPGACTIRQDR